MLFAPRAADLDPVDLESALLRAAIGDYTSEAAILLLANAGHWLPALAAADLITVDTDEDDTAPPTGQVPGVAWAAIAWTELDEAVRVGRIEGSSGQLRILRSAASIADGRPVDLGDVASGLDRRHLQLLLAALSHAGGSHEHHDADAGTQVGEQMPPLVPWPARD
ncbi:hypothetical protein [Klenkia taihuensis]|uniref:Uncharacterized protein n=1 Tax=Klenkia taihuensis TaxID=1225127 RepID=A0A1I1UDE2_9ACTN|nr:hypothetical protein [Klenkia taihuensis]GHE06922.1 hypothetical protein GCM10011381_00740 [Klenkia taihuensis]SFD65980.1 hypothetical protein SAMN05661030_3924 [Klenkia taihuensis]